MLQGSLAPQTLFLAFNHPASLGLSWRLSGKNPPANAEDTGLRPGSGRSNGEGNSNPLQHPCLENPMDRGTWWTKVHGVARVRQD